MKKVIHNGLVTTSYRSCVRLRVLSVICVLCSFLLQAQDAPELYKTASQHYKANEFEQAATAYEKILAKGYHTPEVYYNLGNSYYKLKNTGRAILNYERAHNLAPEDEDIIHNLKLAQLKTVDKLQPVPQLAIVTQWNNLLNSQSSKGWSMFAIGFVWVSLVLFAVYFLIARKGIVLFLSLFVLALSFVSVGLGFKQAHSEENSDTAILMVANVNIKSAPDANGNDIFTIHEGIKLELLDQVGGWTKIRLADGKVGWVEKNMFEKI
ncbi:MAG TPA: tetratricopeptide repeat protein [Chitinophagales bacterium]|nr:tetratricopeptide repeat protein [Chitinophagales bacterium]